jgi:tetratricopeptide (TPR) repeat protein
MSGGVPVRRNAPLWPDRWPRADATARVFALLLLAAVLVPGFPSGPANLRAQAPGLQTPPAASSRYLELVQRYRDGEWEATVNELAHWDSAHVRAEARVFSLLTSPKPIDLAELRESLAPDWPARIRLIESVVLLHTEVLLRDASDKVHFEQAWRAINALTKWPQAEAFFQSACIVLSSRLLSLFNPPEAQQVLRYAKRTGEIALALGSVSESAIPRGRIMPSIVPLSGGDAGRRFGTLEHAGNLFEEALRLDPSLTEARVRLGRVLVARGFTGPAIEHLERARREAPEGFLAYVAALFLGAAHEQQGAWGTAVECYRAALAEYPESQAAYLALGHVLELSGHPDEGWKTVREMFGEAAATRNPERDPWWVYFDGQSWQTEHRIAQMRAMLQR